MATRPYAASTLPCFTGKTIHDGRFLLLAELGAGAFGKVYQALDTAVSQDNPSHHQQYYAVKITHRHPANSKKETLQKREANLHRLVSDLPNVVTFEGTLIYDDKYAYMVLDYVAGGDLYKVVVEENSFYLQEERIRKAFLQIVDGVLGCHARGVYHRDLKCENILISEDGEHLFVTDFGLATKEKFSSAFGCGSAHYMSPEIINEDKLAIGYDSPANDVWSLGVILVNMATGRNPWYKAVRTDVCFSSFLKDCNFLTSVLPISEPFNELLKRVFDVNPLTRIHLHEFRQQVVALKRFLLTPEELVHAPICARIAYAEAKRGQVSSSLLSSGSAIEEEVEPPSSSDPSSSGSCSGDAARLVTPPSRPVIPVGISPENDDIPELPNFSEVVGSPVMPTTPRMQPKPRFQFQPFQNNHDLPLCTGDAWGGLAFEKLVIPTRRKRVQLAQKSRATMSESDSM